MGELVYLNRDPWVTKKELARQWNCSVRHIEYQIKDGMPSMLIAGKRQMKVSACERWLRENQTGPAA